MSKLSLVFCIAVLVFSAHATEAGQPLKISSQRSPGDLRTPELNAGLAAGNLSGDSLTFHARDYPGRWYPDDNFGQGFQFGVTP